MVEYKGFST